MANLQRPKQQKAIDDYLERIKLRELFKGLLRQVVINQPSSPFDYFHEEISRIKKEMEEANIDIGSTTFLTTQFPPTENQV